MLKPGDPRNLGFSPDGLTRLDAAVTQRVDNGVLQGAVLLVARHGGVAYHRAFGMADAAAGQAMAPDAIFRIASMTKPLVSLAAMMLVERGELTLATPVDEVLPVFANLQVAVPKADGAIELVPALRKPTVLDLLRHTAGFAYDWYGTSAVKALYRDAGLRDEADDTAAHMAKIAALPLEHQPGQVWGYSVATDVLGAVVEAVTGRRLDAVIGETITGPLGMVDTGFHVPPEKLARLVPMVRRAETPMPDVSRPPVRCKAGGGMVSTAADYARFCQCWLNGGVLDGVRLVSRKTVELMVADNLPPGIGFDPDTAALFGPGTPSPENGLGFGLGFSVRTAAGRAPWHGSVGAMDWMGVTGCAFFIDPAEELLAILLSHAPMQMLPNMYLLRAMVYQAIDD